MKVHISLCNSRRGCDCAVFDEHFKVLRDFESHPDEEAALFDAEKWCLEQGHEVTKVVRPRITKMRIS